MSNPHDPNRNSYRSDEQCDLCGQGAELGPHWNLRDDRMVCDECTEENDGDE